MGKIYMIGAMKGGVGKSVSVFNLAYSLKKRGKKVLAVDFDPQSNLTSGSEAETGNGYGEDAVSHSGTAERGL